MGLRRICRCHPWGGSGVDEGPLRGNSIATGVRIEEAHPWAGGDVGPEGMLIRRGFGRREAKAPDGHEHAQVNRRHADTAPQADCHAGEGRRTTGRDRPDGTERTESHREG